MRSCRLQVGGHTLRSRTPTGAFCPPAALADGERRRPEEETVSGKSCVPFGAAGRFRKMIFVHAGVPSPPVAPPGCIFLAACRHPAQRPSATRRTNPTGGTRGARQFPRRTDRQRTRGWRCNVGYSLSDCQSAVISRTQTTHWRHSYLQCKTWNTNQGKTAGFGLLTPRPPKEVHFARSSACPRPP